MDSDQTSKAAIPFTVFPAEDYRLLTKREWTIPKFSRSEIDRAGDTLINEVPVDFDEFVQSLVQRKNALGVINNWRSSHSYPLQVLKMTLLSRAKRIDSHAVIAQRLKRLTSIEAKLRLKKGMKLSRMHDLGGCRAVLSTMVQLDALRWEYEKSKAKNPNRHEFVKPYDYIAEPKPDGYRSVHLVYKYRSQSPRYAMYNDLRIEIQIRSRLQHAWATAVETVSTFTGQALKSNVGDEDWKRFFALMGSAIAIREARPTVPGTPTIQGELIGELKQLSLDLNVESVLDGWGKAVQETESSVGAHLFLLRLDSNARSIKIKGFRKHESTQASEEYLRTEEESAKKPEIQAVLVSVDSLGALRAAYPNYYLDTTAFIKAMKRAIGEQ